MRRLLPFATSLLLACTSTLSAQTASPPKNTIIILDASGSMWGQINGQAKIEIAREVIAGFIAELPAGTELGLVAYGHRRKGDCEDIELIVEPGALDKAAFQKVVDSLNPKGMTPLTDAVIFAAEALLYSEEKATVVLVTDGKETCDKDPCAAAQALEKAGVDFTAHVIAFDVAKEDLPSLECLSRDTGGMFLTADDAATLGDALNIAVEPEPEEPEPEANPDPATLTAPATVTAGNLFKVEWTGPNDKADFITIVPKDTEEGKWDNYVYTRKGSPSDLTALMDPGVAEIRYVHGRTRKTLGRTDITITPATVTLKAQEETIAGARIPVEWTGPDNAGDFITIVPIDTEEDKWAKYAYTRHGSPVEVTTPIKPGSAEIRYLSGQDRRVLARIPLKLLEPTATVKGPESAVAGSKVTIEWTGPDNERDFVTIVTADTPESKWAKYQYTRTGPKLEIEVPMTTGPAEIRYVTGQGRETLARAPITVTEGIATLKAPAEAVAGSVVPVEWTGPANARDFITIVTADTPESKWAKYKYTRQDSPLEIEAPMTTGPAEIRYLAGANHETLARIPINIVAAKVTLSAAEKAIAGRSVSITWKGPDNPGDFITVAPKDLPEKKWAKYKYTRSGSPLEVLVPAEAGPCEIRYIAGQNRETLARIPLEVIPPEE